MKISRKNIFLAAVLCVVVVGALGWSWTYLDDQRSAAVASINEADACERIGQAIDAQRSRGNAGTSEPARQMELARLIARAAADAKLSGRNIDRIEPDAPRHSPAGFTEKPTRLLLHDVTLAQFVMLLQTLDSPGQGLRVSQLHLTAPNNPADSRTWTAEATLIYVIPDATGNSSAMISRNEQGLP